MVAISPAESPDNAIPKKTGFRWTYIALPAGILLVTVIMVAIFYGRLPSEVAYHFNGGVPDMWMGRGAIIIWTLVPQIILVLAGLGVSATSSILGQRSLPEPDPLVKRLFVIMGNIVALPQAILAFAMLDIFLYNSYEIHLIPLWVFALIVMVLGGAGLGIFFMRAIRQSRGLRGNKLQERN